MQISSIDKPFLCLTVVLFCLSRANLSVVLAGPHPFRFCQLGDIQIGFGLDGWQNDTYRMGQAAQQVNAQKFDFCIAVGDLTNDRLVPEVNTMNESTH